MRFKKSIIVSLLIASFSLGGCNLDNTNYEWYRSSVQGIKLLDYWTDPDDFFDKAELGVTLSEYPDVTFRYDRSTSELKANLYELDSMKAEASKDKLAKINKEKAKINEQLQILADNKQAMEQEKQATLDLIKLEREKLIQKNKK